MKLSGVNWQPTKAALLKGSRGSPLDPPAVTSESAYCPHRSHMSPSPSLGLPSGLFFRLSVSSLQDAINDRHKFGSNHVLPMIKISLPGDQALTLPLTPQHVK